MKEYGLLISGCFVSATKNDSYAKLPPGTLQQQQQSMSFFIKCGPTFTITTYEKLFETFGLMTMTDATIAPITPTGINMLCVNNDYINYYHCLEKDKGINNMLKERLASKEINIVYSYKNGPYQFELNRLKNNHDSVLFNSSIEVNNESENEIGIELTFLNHVLNEIFIHFFSKL